MELFDVYDKDRNKLNYTKERGSILNSDEYAIGCEIWIFNEHKLLITKRSENKSHPLKWEVPGGCSQSGEDSSDTLVREAKEEINFFLDDGEYTLIHTSLYKNMYVDMYKTNKKLDLDKIILQEEEVCDIKFVTKEEFIELNNNGEIVESVFNRYLQIEDIVKEDW